MEKFIGLQPKTYSHLKDNNDEGRKAKGTKRYVMKRELKFKIIKMLKVISNFKYNKLFRKERNWCRLPTRLKTRQRFKSERHNAFTEEINKITLSSNDDKRIQSIDSAELMPVLQNAWYFRFLKKWLFKEKTVPVQHFWLRNMTDLVIYFIRNA